MEPTRTEGAPSVHQVLDPLIVRSLTAGRRGVRAVDRCSAAPASQLSSVPSSMPNTELPTRACARAGRRGRPRWPSSRCSCRCSMLPSERGPLGRRGRARDRVRPVEHQVEDLVKHLDHEDLIQERGAVGAALPRAMRKHRGTGVNPQTGQGTIQLSNGRCRVRPGSPRSAHPPRVPGAGLQDRRKPGHLPQAGTNPTNTTTGSCSSSTPDTAAPSRSRPCRQAVGYQSNCLLRGSGPAMGRRGNSRSRWRFVQFPPLRAVTPRCRRARPLECGDS